MSLEQRIERLERHCRLWRSIAASCGVFVVVAVTVGADTNKDGVATEVRAKQFILVDDDGNKLVVIAPNESGTGSIKTYSGDQTETVSVSSDDSGGNITVRDINGKGAMLVLGHALALTAGNGKPTIMIDGNDKGGGRIDIYNNLGKPTAILGSNNLADGALHLLDKSGKEFFVCGHDAGHLPVAILSGSNGPVVSMMTTSAGGSFQVHNSQGKRVVDLQASRDLDGAVGVMNKNGELKRLLSASKGYVE